MPIAGHPYQVLTDHEIQLIHASAMRILQEVGMQIQNENLLHRLADFDLPVNFQSERVYFPATVVDRWLEQCDKYDWDAHTPTVTSQAGVYHGKFHDPQSNLLLPGMKKN